LRVLGIRVFNGKIQTYGEIHSSGFSPTGNCKELTPSPLFEGKRGVMIEGFRNSGIYWGKSKLMAKFVLQGSPQREDVRRTVGLAF